MDTTRHFRVYQNCASQQTRSQKTSTSTHSSALSALSLILSIAICLRRTLPIASCCKQLQKLCIVIGNVNNAKTKLASARVLTHYDPQLPVNMTADASAYSVRAVLFHSFPDGSERSVAFASNSLTPSVSNYAQIEKESSCYYFQNEQIPSLSLLEMLCVYKYNISYKPFLEHSNADGLSCLALATMGTQPDHVAHPFNIGLILSLPVMAEDVQNAACSDRDLSKVYRYAQNGLPGSVSADQSSAFQIQSG